MTFENGIEATTIPTAGVCVAGATPPVDVPCSETMAIA
jgi:hypothetical protein